MISYFPRLLAKYLQKPQPVASYAIFLSLLKALPRSLTEGSAGFSTLAEEEAPFELGHGGSTPFARI